MPFSLVIVPLVSRYPPQVHKELSAQRARVQFLCQLQPAGEIRSGLCVFSAIASELAHPQQELALKVMPSILARQLQPDAKMFARLLIVPMSPCCHPQE